MNSNAGKVIAGIGAALAIVCFFIPWVQAGSIRGVLPAIKPILSILRPELGSVVDTLRQISSLSGLKLALSGSLTATPFKVLVALPLILGVLTLIWLLVSSLGAASASRAVDLGLALLGTAVAIVLIFNTSNITHVGHGSNPLVAGLTGLLGFRLTWGFWGSLIAVVLMTAGAALGISDEAGIREEDDPYSYSP